jgi:NADPH2:quinone reductase
LLAVRCRAFGQEATLDEVPEPVVAREEMLVEVRAAAVNFPDLLILANAYQQSPEPPFTVGSEFAGRVVAIGADGDASWLGRDVLGGVLTGAFAERIAVPTTALSVMPAALDHREGAAFRVGYETAFHALVTIGQAVPGDWVVVLGCSGGVGSASVDLAVRLGMRVIAAGSTEERVKRAEAAGAVAGVVYSRADLKAEIKRITGAGADLVIDPVGGEHAEAALRAVRWGGRFITVGFAAGAIPRIPLNLVLLKGAIVRGFQLPNIDNVLPGSRARASQALTELARRGMRPHIGAVYPLKEATAALRDVRQRRVIGKAVIDMSLD